VVGRRPPAGSPSVHLGHPAWERNRLPDGRPRRKERGIRTTRDLAELIKGASVTESIIENIESGRKVNLDVAQLLNIAMALEVPPSYLLAPMASPDSEIDLTGLSDAFRGMTALQFDAWLSADTGVTYLPTTVNERYARLELEALGNLNALDAELDRLAAMIQVHHEASHLVGILDVVESYQQRIAAIEAERSRLHAYLTSGGWDLPAPRPRDLRSKEASA